MPDLVPNQQLETHGGAAAAIARQLDVALAAQAGVAERLMLIRQAVPGRIAFSTSLGLEDQVILAAIASATLDIDVFTLDTGRLFAETIDVLDESQYRLKVPIRVLAPEATAVEALVTRDGVLGFRYSIAARKACCETRKVAPLRRGLAGAAGWITGMRRAQGATRTQVPFAEWDGEHQLIKLDPLADWSLEQVEDFVRDAGVPVNALHARGYPSIGCQPCTRAVQPGEDIRAGRWWWESESGKECGLHNRPKAATVESSDAR